MNGLYQSNTQNTLHFGRGAAAETPIFLAAEQILVQNTPQNQRSDQNAIIRLAASIRKYGILEPLSVKLSTQKDGFPVYELVDGERRFRAAALAGLGKLPCLILPPNDPKCLQMAAILALRSEKLHYFALAESFLHLIEEYHMTQEEIARKMGLSQSAIANKLRLLKLTPEERRLLVAGGFTERHARAFLRISDATLRLEAITVAEREGCNVASTESLVDRYTGRSRGVSAETAAKARENDVFERKNPQNKPQIPSNALQAPSSSGKPLLPQKPIRSIAGSSVTPTKFVLRDLKPLYTSIERTLGIFEKTGVCAEYTKEEDEDFARIFICIPKRG